MDAHRADIIARHAGKTAIHLLDQVGGYFQFAFQTFASQGNPTAWRSGFVVVFVVGRAYCQAQPAADTIQVFILFWFDDQFIFSHFICTILIYG